MSLNLLWVWSRWRSAYDRVNTLFNFARFLRFDASVASVLLFSGTVSSSNCLPDFVPLSTLNVLVFTTTTSAYRCDHLTRGEITMINRAYSWLGLP